jgi:hypothetical protein
MKAKLKKRKSKIVLTLFVVLFAGIGVYFIINSFAASTPDKLIWSAPTLVNPITKTVVDGYNDLVLDTTKDYIIKMPDTKHTGAITIDGGHNVVLIGGYTTVPARPLNSTDDTLSRAIYIRGNMGAVHIEGLKIDNSAGGADFDAFAINADQSIVQIENVRVTGLTGSSEAGGWHADVIQPWGGVKELRVDHLTGSSNYQGLYLQNQVMTDGTHGIGSVSVHNVNLFNTNVSTSGGGVLAWTTNYGACDPSPMTFDEVYVVPKTNATLGDTVYPYSNTSFGCPSVISGSAASWPSLTNISGSIKSGSPANGDFVPDSNSGLGYVSPGYISNQTPSAYCPDPVAGNCRPFPANSPWNTSIPSNVAVDPLSSTYINRIQARDLPLTSDPDQYTFPVYISDASSPLENVYMYRQWTTQGTSDSSTTHFGWQYNDRAIKFTGNVSNGSATITGVSSFTGLVAGMLINDITGLPTPLIPTCTRIVSLNPGGGSLVVDQSATGSKSALSLGQSNSIGCDQDGNHVPLTAGATWQNVAIPTGSSKYPKGVKASVGTDSHMIIWDTSKGIEYEFWRFGERFPAIIDSSGNYAGGGRYIKYFPSSLPPNSPPPVTLQKAVAEYPDNADSPWNVFAGGTQANPYPSNAKYNAWDGGNTYTNDPNHYGAGVGTRASYNPGLAGLVRPWEIAQGHIDHALSFAYHQPAGNFRWPAVGGFEAGLAGTDLPLGARIQLNPALSQSQIQGLGCTGPCLIIAQALQKYGMYVTDNSNSSKIYLEERTTAGWDSSYSRSLVSPLTPGNSWSNFRVVAAPCDARTATCPVDTPPTTTKPGDTNGDGLVNITDLSTLLSHYSTNYAAADFNKDSIVNITDLSVLLSFYGK